MQTQKNTNTIGDVIDGDVFLDAAATAAAAAALPDVTPTDPPPGIENLKKLKKYETMVAQLLINVGERGLCDFPPNSRKKEHTDAWRACCDSEFGPGGVFAGCKKWVCKNPTTEKFKPLVMKLIDHNSDEHERSLKRGDETTLVQQAAFNLKRQRDAAKKAKSERENMKTAQRMQSEAVEEDMGFDMPIMGMGIAAPNLRPTPTPTSVSQEQLDAVQVLGTTTQSRSLKPSGKPNIFFFDLLVPKCNV